MHLYVLLFLMLMLSHYSPRERWFCCPGTFFNTLSYSLELQWNVFSARIYSSYCAPLLAPLLWNYSHLSYVSGKNLEHNPCQLPSWFLYYSFNHRGCCSRYISIFLPLTKIPLSVLVLFVCSLLNISTLYSYSSRHNYPSV